jgi:hypothetical protein
MPHWIITTLQCLLAIAVMLPVFIFFWIMTAEDRRFDRTLRHIKQDFNRAARQARRNYYQGRR